MAEPLARTESGSDGPLADAAHRLDHALQRLEAVLASTRAGPPDAPPASAGVVELEDARRRNRELQTAAADASRALGRAMAQVRLALREDEAEAQDPQTSLFAPGLLDEAADSPLESGPGLSDEQDGTEAGAPAVHKEPTP